MLISRNRNIRALSNSPIHRLATSTGRIVRLSDNDVEEVNRFLKVRPVHTVVLASFIRDNGFDDKLNRGAFYGYRDDQGQLSGVALLGHSTLIEAHGDDAVRAFARETRARQIKLSMVMGEDDIATDFWGFYAGSSKPRLSCTELLFETRFPLLVRQCEFDVRRAKHCEIAEIAAAHAEVAFIESGIDPMLKDREGFLSRVARRIEMGRTFVVFDDNYLVFKADIVAEADGIIYLEGLYVGPEYRGKGIGSRCLSRLTQSLLERANTICMLSNEQFSCAHKCFKRAGYRASGRCTTLFT